jgi:glycine/D-amino acid oxidase-like deaminating enzyme
MTDQAVDVVVVGNGAIGTTTAIRLAIAAPDLRVALVGPADRVGSASDASGALLGCFGEVTTATFASDAGRERFAIQLAAHAAWPDHLAELAEHAPERRLLVSNDSYVVLNARGGVLDSHNYAAMLGALRDHGVIHEDVDQVPGMRPNPDSRPLRAIRLRAEGAVDARAVMDALSRQALQSGVVTLDGTVRAVRTEGGAAVGVLLGNESIDAGHVVVATGAATTPLLEGLECERPIQPVLAGSGFAIVADRVMGEGFSSAVRTVNRAGSCGLHIVPLGGGREYLGATNVIFRTPELRPHLGVGQFLITSAIDQLDALLSYSRIHELRIGNRPVSLDAFPLLGEGPVRDLTVLTGTYRDGFHAAPELARLAAQTVVGGTSTFPRMFAPTRVPIFTMTVEESIDAFVANQVGSAYEGGIRTTPFIAGDDLGGMFRPLAERLYERLAIDVGLHPDIVSYLCLTRKEDDDVTIVADYLREAGLSR